MERKLNEEQRRKDEDIRRKDVMQRRRDAQLKKERDEELRQQKLAEEKKRFIQNILQLHIFDGKNDTSHA